MMKKMLKLSWFFSGFIMLMGLTALAACAPATPAPTPTTPAYQLCSTDYRRHILTSPYYLDTNSPPPVYTLTPAEFSAALAKLGIKNLCVPADADAPYLVRDWKVGDGTTTQGQMKIYTFDAWRTAQIVYATYDLAGRPTADLYATAADYDEDKPGAGFERIYGRKCFETCTVFRTYVVPFADHYVALTLNLGELLTGSSTEALIEKFKAGEYPAKYKEDNARFDTLLRGLEVVQP